MGSEHIGHSFTAGIDFLPNRTLSYFPVSHSHVFGRLIVAAGSDDPRRAAECFADEVIVDFPSVAPAVDRMRRAFMLDERGEALPAAVRISPREARQGVRIPVHVPMRSTCPDCGGRGETWAEVCPRCQGSGTELREQRLRVSVPPGVIDGSRFSLTVAGRHNPPTRIELHVRVS